MLTGSPALSFSLPDPARRWSRSSPALFFARPHWLRAWNRLSKRQLSNLFTVANSHYQPSWKKKKIMLRYLAILFGIPLCPSPIAFFLVLPNFHSCLYDSIETLYMFSISLIKFMAFQFIDQLCDNYKLTFLRTIFLCCYYNHEECNHQTRRQSSELLISHFECSCFTTED